MSLVRFVLLLLLAVLAPRTAEAHDPGLSRGDYAVVGSTVTATLVFARRDLAHATKGDYVGVLGQALVVRGDGVACPVKLSDASPFETDATRVVLQASCARAPARVEIEVALLAALPFGHRHLAHVVGPGAPPDASLTVSARTFAFAPPTPTTLVAAPPSAVGFVGMGLEHIVTGFDHLVFLLGLVIVQGRRRDLLLVVTAFTVGHSISLALATFGVFTPSARFVEPAIALSIVWVGVENVVTARPRARARITLPFGLVHGFGFATALREIGLPRAQLPAALLFFNVGVEVGQVLALAATLPVLHLLRRWPAFAERGVRVVSLGVAVAGVVWFVARVRGS